MTPAQVFERSVIIFRNIKFSQFFYGGQLIDVENHVQCIKTPQALVVRNIQIKKMIMITLDRLHIDLLYRPYTGKIAAIWEKNNR